MATPTTEAAEARTPIDLTSLTLGEVAKLEDLSGLPLSRIADEDAPQGKLLAAMVFISERRRGNAIPWPECLAMDVPTAMEALGMDQDADEDDQGDEDQAGE